MKKLTPRFHTLTTCQSAFWPNCAACPDVASCTSGAKKVSSYGGHLPLPEIQVQEQKQQHSNSGPGEPLLPYGVK